MLTVIGHAKYVELRNLILTLHRSTTILLSTLPQSQSIYLVYRNFYVVNIQINNHDQGKIRQIMSIKAHLIIELDWNVK